MPLKPCIAATSNLDATDVDVILENFDSYNTSMSQDKAARLAIDDAISSAQEERAETLDIIYQAYPDLAPKSKEDTPTRGPEEVAPSDTAFEHEVVDISSVKGMEGAHAADRATGFIQETLDGTKEARRPPSVRRETDGTFTVLDGRSYITAAKRNGFQKVPVRVIIEADPNNPITPELQAEYDKAARAKDKFDKAMEKLAEKHGGIFKDVDLKAYERATWKIENDYEGDPTRIKDLLRGTISVSDISEVRSVLDELLNEFQVPTGKKKDGKDVLVSVTPVGKVKTKILGIKSLNFGGYSDVNLVFEIAGSKAEIQINTRDMLTVKSFGHQLYQAYREATEEQMPMVRAMRELELKMYRDAHHISKKGTASPELALKIVRSHQKVIDELNAQYGLAINFLNSTLDTFAPLWVAEPGGNFRGGSVSHARQVLESQSKTTGTPSTSNMSADAGIESTSNIDITSTDIVPQSNTTVMFNGQIVPPGQPVQPGSFVARTPETKTSSGRRTGQALHDWTESIRSQLRKTKQRDGGTRDVNFQIVETQADAFGEKGTIDKIGPIKGGYWEGTDDILIVAENIKDMADLMTTLRHEMVSHYGLRKLLNKDGRYDKLLKRVYAARNGELKKSYDYVARVYPDLVEKGDTRTIADEMLAYMAETPTKTTFIKKIYDQIIKWLNQIGLGGKSISQREVNSLIRSSVARLRQKARSVYSTEPYQSTDNDVAPRPGIALGSRGRRGGRGDLSERKASVPSTAMNDYRKEQEARPIVDYIDVPITNKDGSYRKNASGDITGAPPGTKTKKQVTEIVTTNIGNMEDPLAQMPSSAEWYEVSGEAIRNITNGDPQLTEKLVRMMAVLSASNQVGGNTTGAIKAIYQLARGETAASGRWPNKFKLISDRILNADDMGLAVPGVDSKVMSFYHNLWDATFQSDKYEHASTMDMWMARLYGYNLDTFSPAQYRFANMVTQQITTDYNKKHKTNLKPRQIQAALWVYARNREKFGDSIGADVALDDRSAFDTYIDRARQHITLEAMPAVNSGLFPEIHDATPEQKTEYTRQAIQLILNEKGENELFNRIGIPLYTQQPSEGSFAGAVSPNEILSVVADKDVAEGTRPSYRTTTEGARPKANKQEVFGPGKPKVNKQEVFGPGKPKTVVKTKDANLAAQALQYIYSQNAVPWFQLDPSASGAAQGVAVYMSEQPNVGMEEAFIDYLRERVSADFTRVGNDFFMLNFDVKSKGNPNGITNKAFKEKVGQAVNDYMAENLPGSELIQEIVSDVKARSEYFGDPREGVDEDLDWSDAAAVSALEDAISEGGGQDLLGWARRRREAVGRLQADFRDEQGLAPRLAARRAEQPQTETSAFKKWFGKSTTVDSTGKPLVLYHGTDKSFDTFKMAGNGFTTKGWFTADPDVAAKHAGKDGANTMPVYIRIERPTTIEAAVKAADKAGVPITEREAWVKERWDGLVVEQFGSTTYIPLDNKQVKSSVGNTGAFDASDPSLVARREDLPMDKESRLERAREQGFDVDTVLYHGTGRGRNFDEFNPGRSMMSFFTPDESYAAQYGETESYYIRSDKVFDMYSNPEHLKKAIDLFNARGGWRDAVELNGADLGRDDYNYNSEQDLQWELLDDPETDILSTLVEEGYDTFVFEERKGIPATGVLDPSRIRSVNAAFAPTETDSPKLLFQRAAQDAQDAPTAGNLGMPEETLKDKFVRVAQDSFNRVKQMQTTLAEDGGRVTHESDVYRAEELSSSKITHRLKLLDREYMQPLLKLLKDNKITIDELDEFMIAKHAQERNEYIATINDEMPDGGSGMLTADALAILGSNHAKRAAMEEAAAIVYAVNDKALDDAVEGGHITQEKVDGYHRRWKYYVPLKGKAGEEGRASLGTGYSIGKTKVQQALGRGEGNLPESPVAHSFAGAETTIVRTEKTKVGQSLVQLIRDNPDPDFWTITKRNYKKFEDVFGEPFEGYDNPPEGMIEDLDYHRKTAMVDGQRKVKYVINPFYGQRDDVFAVMVDGQELLITIKDKVLISQLKKMSTTQLHAIVRGFGMVNRYLAMINTALNPEFVITNFERDFQTAMINLGGEHSAAIAAKVAKGIPGAIRGIWQETFETKGNSEWRDLFSELESEGGTIGFFGLEDIDTKVKKIQSSLIDNHGMLGRTKQGIRAVRDVVLDANLSVENAARLSAYKVIKGESIKNGMSEKEAKARAASVAKNLTVNFNRKGEWAPVLNSAYLFANASIQGSARIITALKYPRVRKIVGSVAGAMFALAMYNRDAGGDDDDGIPYWDKISDYTKQTNLIIMHPDGSGNYSKVKMPYGYNVFAYSGTAMHDLMYNPRMTTTQTAMNLLSATMNAYNPIQGADFLDTITPTFLKPYEQDKRNINFMEAPIKPENPFINYDQPESQKAFKSTNETLKEMMSWINEETGGDQTHSGLIDMSPETIKHYVSWLTGGAGMTAARTVGTATNLIKGDEIDMKNVPFLRNLGGKAGSHFDTQRFYDAIKEVNAVEAQIKLYKGTDNYADYRAEQRGVHKLAFKMKSYKNKVKRLRDKRDKAYADDDKDRANEIREEIRQVMMEFSMLYDDAIENQE